MAKRVILIEKMVRTYRLALRFAPATNSKHPLPSVLISGPLLLWPGFAPSDACNCAQFHSPSWLLTAAPLKAHFHVQGPECHL